MKRGVSRAAAAPHKTAIPAKPNAIVRAAPGTLMCAPFVRISYRDGLDEMICNFEIVVQPPQALHSPIGGLDRAAAQVVPVREVHARELAELAMAHAVVGTVFIDSPNALIG